MPAYDHSLCYEQLKRKRTDSKRHLANDNDRLIEKQIPSSPRAASFKSLYLKRPYTASQLPVLRSGRFRYSTKTYGAEVWIYTLHD
jgi:hypothetical protein